MADDINAMRQRRKVLTRNEATITEKLKQLDQQQRALRGELDKTRKEARTLTSQITKLAKTEEEL